MAFQKAKKMDSASSHGEGHSIMARTLTIRAYFLDPLDGTTEGRDLDCPTLPNLVGWADCLVLCHVGV